MKEYIGTALNRYLAQNGYLFPLTEIQKIEFTDQTDNHEAHEIQKFTTLLEQFIIQRLNNAFITRIMSESMEAMNQSKNIFVQLVEPNQFYKTLDLFIGSPENHNPSIVLLYKGNYLIDYSDAVTNSNLNVIGQYLYDIIYTHFDYLMFHQGNLRLEGEKRAPNGEYYSQSNLLEYHLQQVFEEFAKLPPSDSIRPDSQN